MEAERKFWSMLDENVLRVENWYNKQIDHFTEQFHILTLQAIQLVRNSNNNSLITNKL